MLFYDIKGHSSNRWLQLVLRISFEEREECLSLFQRNVYPKSLLVASWNNDGTTQIYGCKCSLWYNNTPYIEISVKYILYLQFMVGSALLKSTTSIEEWVAATSFVKSRNTVLWKNRSMRLNIVTYKEKKFFLEQLLYFGSHSFLWASIALRFLYICK